MTDISVEVVSRPQKAHQSLTTIPAPITSDPRLMVPTVDRGGEGGGGGGGEESVRECERKCVKDVYNNNG